MTPASPPPPEHMPTGEGRPPTAPPTRTMAVRMPTYPVRVTYACLGLILLVFAAQFILETFMGIDPLLAFGAKDNVRIAHGEIWRLLTAVFLHANVLHIAFNAYALYYLGRQTETFYGPLRFGLVFLLAGLSGSVASLLFSRFRSVGASGAIFGLIGAEAVLLYRNRKVFGERGRRALQNIVVIAGINLLIGLQGSIDNWAHLGGLIGGLMLGWFIGPVWVLNAAALTGAMPSLEDEHPLTGARWLAVLAFLLGLALLTGVAVALQG